MKKDLYEIVSDRVEEFLDTTADAFANGRISSVTYGDYISMMTCNFGPGSFYELYMGDIMHDAKSLNEWEAIASEADEIVARRLSKRMQEHIVSRRWTGTDWTECDMYCEELIWGCQDLEEITQRLKDACDGDFSWIDSWLGDESREDYETLIYQLWYDDRMVYECEIAD